MPTPWTSDITVLVAKLKGKRSILTVHNDMDKPDLFGKIITWIYLHTFFQVTLYFVDKIIIVNPHWKTAFKKTRNIFERFSSKITTLPNGVDTEMFQPSTNKSKHPTILFVSILDEHHRFKGFNYLIHAIPKIKEKIPNVKLIVVGEGALVDEYREESKKMGVEDVIEFHGKKTQEELIQYYQRSNVFVLPSIEIEGFGIVLLEAMASGIPVVTTDVAGVAPEISQHKTGMVVAKANSKELADVIIAILENVDDQRRMGARGRKLIEERYGWGMIAKKISKIFNELLP